MARSGELRRATSNRAARPIGLGAASVTAAVPPQVDEQFDQLYRKRAPGLRRYARIRVGEQASEDIVQISFSALYRAMTRPEDGEHKRKQIDDPWAYLKGIARHVIAKHYRHAAKRPQFIPLPEDDLAISVQSHHQDHADRIAQQIDVYRAKKQLTDRQQQVASLRYDDDLPELDIAARLGLTRGGVSAHLNHINASLKRQLRGYGPKEGRHECP
jgi:RNA polymerase sigma factor (sigma-70 family)